VIKELIARWRIYWFNIGTAREGSLMVRQHHNTMMALYFPVNYTKFPGGVYDSALAWRCVRNWGYESQTGGN